MMEEPTDLCVVWTTFPDDATAERVLRVLLEERLVACATRLPVQSMYWWEDQIQHDPEVQVWLKTPRARIPGLYQRLKELHPYSVPEFLVFSLEAAGNAYARWAKEVTKEGA